MLKHLKYLSLLVFAAFIFRFTTLLLKGEYVINPDGTAYTALARRLAAGDFYGFFDTYWSPLYPFVLSFFVPFTDSPELPGILTSLVFSCLLPIPVFFLVKQHYGIKEGYLSAAITVVYQFLLDTSSVMVPEPIYFFLITCVVLVGWQTLNENKTWKFFLIGLLLGLSYLTRPEGIIYVGWFAVLILLKFFTNSNYKQGLKNILILVLGFLIFALPYLIYLREATGGWTISGKFAKHFIGGNIYNPKHLTSQTNVVVKFFKTLVFNLDRVHEQFIYLYPPLIMMITAIGLFRKKWETERFRKELYFLSFFVVSVACYAVTVVETRYLAVTLPILFAWLAKGFYELREWFFETLVKFYPNGFPLLKNNFFYGLICISLIFVYLLPTAYIEQPADNIWQFNRFEMKEAGLWLKNNVPPHSVVLSSNYTTAFYAGSEHEQMTDQESLIQVKNKKPDYLVMYERDFKNSGEFSTEIEKLRQSDKFEMIYQNEKKSGYEAVIFRVKNNGE